MAGLRARVVIDDCRVAIETLDECEFGPEWRRSWVTVVALLRAVGHVLQKVDARTDARMAEMIRHVVGRRRRSNCYGDSGPPGELHMHVFNEGPFVGRHQVAVAKAALAWWESYLAEVETRLRE